MVAVFFRSRAARMAMMFAPSPPPTPMDGSLAMPGALLQRHSYCGRVVPLSPMQPVNRVSRGPLVWAADAEPPQRDNPLANLRLSLGSEADLAFCQPDSLRPSPWPTFMPSALLSVRSTTSGIHNMHRGTKSSSTVDFGDGDALLKKTGELQDKLDELVRMATDTIHPPNSRKQSELSTGMSSPGCSPRRNMRAAAASSLRSLRRSSGSSAYEDNYFEEDTDDCHGTMSADVLEELEDVVSDFMNRVNNLHAHVHERSVQRHTLGGLQEHNLQDWEASGPESFGLDRTQSDGAILIQARRGAVSSSAPRRQLQERCPNSEPSSAMEKSRVREQEEEIRRLKSEVASLLSRCATGMSGKDDEEADGQATPDAEITASPVSEEPSDLAASLQLWNEDMRELKRAQGREIESLREAERLRILIRARDRELRVSERSVQALRMAVCAVQAENRQLRNIFAPYGPKHQSRAVARAREVVSAKAGAEGATPDDYATSSPGPSRTVLRARSRSPEALPQSLPESIQDDPAALRSVLRQCSAPPGAGRSASPLSPSRACQARPHSVFARPALSSSSGSCRSAAKRSVRWLSPAPQRPAAGPQRPAEALHIGSAAFGPQRIASFSEGASSPRINLSVSIPSAGSLSLGPASPPNLSPAGSIQTMSSPFAGAMSMSAPPVLRARLAHTTLSPVISPRGI